MNAFSWFRRRREAPSGRKPLLPDEIFVPFVPVPLVGFTVYCQLDPENTPTPQELQYVVMHWLESHSSDIFRPLLQEYVSKGLIIADLRLREETHEPSEELVRAYNPGELEERRFRNATHAIQITTADLTIPPRVGLWTAIAYARALASALPGGVILDPEYPRLLSLTENRENIPVDGRIRISEHILVPFSRNQESGLVWMTTRGMGRFGLPDLEFRDVPPHLANLLTPVLHGVAQWLSDKAMCETLEISQTGGKGATEATALHFFADKTIHLSEIRRAYAPDPLSEASLFPDYDDISGESRIRLCIGASGGDIAPLIRICAPLEAGDDQAIWLNDLLYDLFGDDDELTVIETEDIEQEAAHQKAKETLSLVRDRYRDGYCSRAAFHVKYGFQVTDQKREFLWIAVTRWENGHIRGLLVNEPESDLSLQAGQTVEISESDIYDWLIVHEDGRTEGDFTNRLLSRRQC